MPPLIFIRHDAQMIGVIIGAKYNYCAAVRDFGAEAVFKGILSGKLCPQHWS